MVKCDPESSTVCFTRRAVHVQPRCCRLFLCTICRNRARTSPGKVRIWGMRVQCFESAEDRHGFHRSTADRLSHCIPVLGEKLLEFEQPLRNLVSAPWSFLL